MRRLLVIAVMTMCLVFASSAYADFADRTANDVMQELQGFLDSEKGNTVSEYQILGLATSIKRIFEKNVVKPKPLEEK